jgi:hypothetical protein
MAQSLQFILEDARKDWDRIHFRNNDAEREDLAHWAVAHGKKLIDSLNGLLTHDYRITPNTVIYPHTKE